MKQFWRNYKTTLIGFSYAIFSAIEPIISTGSIDKMRILFGIWVAALGFFAKDYNQ